MCGFHSSHGLADRAEVAADAERVHLVPQLPRACDDVVLRPPGRPRALPRLRLGRRHEVLVHQREDAELLHSATRWRPLWR